MDSVEDTKREMKAYFERRKLCFEVDPSEFYKKTEVYRDLPLRYEIHDDGIKRTLEFYIKGINDESLTKLLNDATSQINSWSACKIIEADSQTTIEMKYRISKELPKEPKKRGINPSKHALRNELIGTAILQCVVFNGYPEYSNGNDEKVTACTLASNVLEEFSLFITKVNIIKIWTNFKKENSISL
jgi:hypothetical protein